MKSLTRTLVSSISATVVVAFLISGITLYLMVRNGLTSHFDNSLRVKLQTLVNTSELEMMLQPSLSAKERAEYREMFEYMLDLDVKAFAEDQVYVRVWDGQGETLYSSPALADFSDQFRYAEFSGDDVTGLDPRWLELPNGDRLRCLSLSLAVAELAVFDYENDDVETEEELKYQRELQKLIESGEIPERITIVFAQDATSLLQDFSLLRSFLLAIGLITSIVLVVVCRLVVSVGLRPVFGLAREIEAQNETDLGRRVSADVPLEMRPIVSRLNGLFDRLETAFRRERAFSSDVAHELRTPLAALRMKIDFAVSKPRSEHESARLFCELQTIIGHLERLVDQMLSLSRLESEVPKVASEQIELGQFMQMTWQSLPLVDRPTVQVEWAVEDGIELTTDRLLLNLLLTIIFSNARTYVDDNGTITVQSSSINAEHHHGTSSVLIAVENTGCTLYPGLAESVFQRFWRGDDSRSNPQDHSGLGLAIAKRLVDILGGTIRATISDQKFNLQIRLPITPD